MTRTAAFIEETAAYGGFADAVGGIVTIVLAILGLAAVAPETMVPIATIVFGVALLIQGGTLLSEYARLIFPAGAPGSSVGQFGGGSLAAVFLAGVGGIVLGILALLGINPTVLTSAAIISFGAALMLSSNSVWNLHHIRRESLSAQEHSPASGSELLANEMAVGSAGMQALAGLAAIVLGILALAGNNAVILALVALLGLGGTLILTGSTLSATVLRLMKPIAGEGTGTRSGPAE
jgi:hypothetical protein